MKKLINSASMAVLLSMSVYAFAQPPVFQPGQNRPDEPPAHCCMMTDQERDELRQHMQHLQNLGDQIRDEQDPARRQELTREHRTQMREGMRRLEALRDSSPERDATGYSLEERLHMTQNYTGMMQMMMNEMMDNIVAELQE